MALVTLTMSMSLDGFIAGPNISHENPLGEGGLRLHDWLLKRSPARGVTATSHEPDHAVNARVARETTASVGAVILGRRIFDTGLAYWEDTPYPVPSFVLTHRPHEVMVMKSATFTFVTDGIQSALRQAAAAAGEKKIMLMGADIAQQFLKAGLLDEIEINLIPVLLGKGVRLFEHFGEQHFELEQKRVLEAPEVTHITYRVRRAGEDQN
jgi:dihydrofolate reductase